MKSKNRIMTKFKNSDSFQILLIICGLLIVNPLFSQHPVIYKPLVWSIVATYTIPGKASGLAWDGAYIYSGIYGVDGNKIYKFDPSNGTYSLQCTGPFEDAFGLTYIGPNLATIKQPTNSSQPAHILEFTMAGSQVNTITLPDHYMSGVAYDAGNYWVCTYYNDPGVVYKVNGQGTVLSSFIPPNNQPWDICLQGSDLWIADYYGNMLYKVTTSGTLLESHASEGIKPSGVVYDGTYLWYCDGELGSNSTLYKIDLQGSGTPIIYVPVTSHDYGTVTIGNSSTWNCEVQNTGTANLVINSITIPSGVPISTTYNTPATIYPGSTAQIPLTYSPITSGTLNTQISINSNDPVNPTVDVILTGNAVFSGPHLNITTTTHSWQERRKNAYSRWNLSVANNGDQPLIITELNMSDSHFIVDEGATLPIIIPTLELVKIGIWFHPSEAGQFSGTLSIVSNDPGQNPFIISLLGTGVDTLYLMGTPLWNYTILSSYDNSPKAITPIPDITGDTVDDVIIASEDDYIRCFNGNASVTGDVLWEKEVYAGSVYQQNAVAIIDDIDNDGFKDVIAGTAWGDRSIIALSGKTGLQIWKHNTHEFGDGGWVYQVDTKYDFNNDGFRDVLAATGDDGNGTGPRRAYCLNGKTGLTIWSRPAQGAAFAVIGIEDFTGDGKPDVVAGATSASESEGKVFGIDGNNGSLKWTFTTAGSSVWALMQIDDVTGDGIKDVASGDFWGNIYFHNAVTGAQVNKITIASAIILRFENMGDVNGDGHPDILVAHSTAKGVVVNGFTNTILWQKPLADKSWTVTNMGDINWDGVNDAAIGTLYTDNWSYFLNGINGNIFESVPVSDAVDALSSIPDIVGDVSHELIVGARNGSITCLSGGYDSTTVVVPAKNNPSFAVSLYPNPCQEVLNITLKLRFSSDVTISISEMTGRNLYSRVIPGERSGIHTYTLNRNTIDPGVVQQGVGIIRIETQQGVFHGKVIFGE